MFVDPIALTGLQGDSKKPSFWRDPGPWSFAIGDRGPIESRIESGVNVVVITTAAEKSATISGEQFAMMHELLHTAGIDVIEKEEVEECFAVFDEDLVWHGGANLLGKEDVWDNLMRVRNVAVSEELLEIAFGKNSN